MDSKRQGDYVYTRLESHNLNGTDYTIVNKAFRSERLTGQAPDDDFISVQYPYQTPVPLSEVEEWASLSEEPVVINNVEKPLFVYIKMPRANNLDPNSPLGTSVYSRATEVIEQADGQFSRILWEYDATEAAIHASADMFDSDKSGKPILPAGRERLYRAFDFESKESFLKEYAPEIRSDPLFKGLNKYFQRIEFLVGLSYGTISDPQDIEKTAEEIRTSKQRSYTVVSRIQSAWVTALMPSFMPWMFYSHSITWLRPEVQKRLPHGATGFWRTPTKSIRDGGLWCWLASTSWKSFMRGTSDAPRRKQKK